MCLTDFYKIWYACSTHVELCFAQKIIAKGSRSSEIHSRKVGHHENFPNFLEKSRKCRFSREKIENFDFRKKIEKSKKKLIFFENLLFHFPDRLGVRYASRELGFAPNAYKTVRWARRYTLLKLENYEKSWFCGENT